MSARFALVAQAKARVLGVVRRGGRQVAWTPEFMGFGNILLLGLWAQEGRDRGLERWVLSTPAIEPWRALFPALDRILIPRDRVAFRDQRSHPWSEVARARGDADTVRPYEPVDIAAVESFIGAYLLPGSDLEGAPDADRTLVVNVRRGDYYDVPAHRGQYAFDQDCYLREALARTVAAQGTPERIRVVSDGMDWCRARLGWLADYAPVEFGPSQGPLADFRLVAGHRRLVLTNSTFSYWAAHVGNVLHGDNHAEVWAPRFFDRTQNAGRSWLLDERWSVVEEIPGGWDS